MSTVPGYQTNLVLHPIMEGGRSTPNINSIYVCLSTLDKPVFSANLVLKSDKMPHMSNGYPGTGEYRQD